MLRRTFTAALFSVISICHHAAPTVLTISESAVVYRTTATSPPVTLHFAPLARAGQTLSWQVSAEVTGGAMVTVELLLQTKGSPTPHVLHGETWPTPWDLGYGITSRVFTHPTRPGDRLSVRLHCAPRAAACTLSNITATLSVWETP
jgi:hypothetical protein